MIDYASLATAAAVTFTITVVMALRVKRRQEELHQAGVDRTDQKVGTEDAEADGRT